MPNRIIREAILSSEKMALLGWPEEVFYRRLMSIVDDYGRYEANPQLLRARCYPLQTDNVRVADITRWMAACQKAGLILDYAVSGKCYLEITNFQQQQRTASKYPAPIESEIICNQTPSNAHLVVDVVVVEDVKTSMSGKPDPAPPIHKKINGHRAESMEVLDFLNMKTGRAYRPVDANLSMIASRLKEGASVADCRMVIAKKTREWRDDEKMSPYLRPATLFNKTKFAQYVGELVEPKEEKHAVP